MSLPNDLASIHIQRADAVRRWKNRGGQVIGYFADDVPTALIEAAGFMAVRLWGDPDGGQPKIMPRGPRDVRADSLEFVNSWVHLISSGAFDFIDHFIISNSRKHILQLVERLRALNRSVSFHILDRAHGRSARAQAFNRAQVVKLSAALADWAGKAITPVALAEAVAGHNRRADILTQIAALRERTDPRMSGTDALRVLFAARWLHSSDFAALADRMAADVPIAGRRLFVSGSGHDHLAAYAAIEASGAVIVGECHDWGARLLEQPIVGAQLEDVATHYAEHADFVVPVSEWLALAAARCARSQAEVHVSYVQAHDDAPLWEAPSLAERIGLPCVALAGQPYGANPKAIGQAISGLCESVAA